jgi:hypothetical protein
VRRFWVVFAFVVVAFPLFAQTTTEQRLDSVTIRANRLSIVAENVLTKVEQSDVFWPIYHRYSREMLKINDRIALLIQDYARHYQTMTDEKAEDLLAESIQIEKDRVMLLESYVKEFKKVLPSKVAVRFYQVENKLDTVIQYELAAQIPLVK